MALQKASRIATKIRMALTGPTNAGKTYSALRIAYGIVKERFPDASDAFIWSKIAVADTERRRALFYASRSDLPLPVGEFLYKEIKAPYDPQKIIDFVGEALQEVGEDGVVIIDSLSHFWSYSGGVLDMKEGIAKQAGKNSYTAWWEAGKIQNNWVDVLLSVPCHVITSMRSKMDYVLEQNEFGKTVPKKVGLAPIQRDDLEYEFDITLMLDKDHNASIIKDTTFLNQIGFEGMLTEDLGMQLAKWVNSGTDPQEFKEEQRLALIEDIRDLCKKYEPIMTYYKSLHPTTKTTELTLEQAKETLERLKEVL